MAKTITAAQALDALDELEGSARGDEPFNYFAAPLLRRFIEQSMGVQCDTPAPQSTEGGEIPAPTGCHRSHPHENMDAECERKTVEARENNARARGMKACEAPSPWKLPPYPATPTEREALAKRQAALGVARPYACPYCDQREGYAHGEWCRGAGTMVKRPAGVAPSEVPSRKNDRG